MKKKLKIALGEANRFDIILIEQALLAAFPEAILEHYRNEEEVFDALSKKHYDVIILDFYIPGKSINDLVTEIRTVAVEVPIIVLSEVPDEQAAVEVMKHGATDYLSKSGNYPAKLPAVIVQAYKYQLRLKRLRRREQKAIEDEKKRISTTMALTLSHEINNPLMAILGNLELMLEDERIAEHSVRRKLEAVFDSACRIKSILKQMSLLENTEIHQTPVGPILKSPEPERSRALVLVDDRTW